MTMKVEYENSIHINYHFYDVKISVHQNIIINNNKSDGTLLKPLSYLSE